MDETNLKPDSTDTAQPLRVLIAYHDLPAGKRAMRVMTDLAGELGDEIEFQVLPWSFDLLTDSGWRAAAEDDAADAEILIIATSSPNPLPPAIRQWAEMTINRKQGTVAAVVALFGPEENPDGAGSSRLEAIQTSVRRAGLDFFAPAPHHKPDDMARIHERAGTVTPLLHEILHQADPAPRWGINE